MAQLFKRGAGRWTPCLGKRRRADRSPGQRAWRGINDEGRSVQDQSPSRPWWRSQRWPARRTPRNAATRRPASMRGRAQFAAEARARGIGPAGISAIDGTPIIRRRPIGADRGQHGFHVSLDQFLAKRGGSAIASRGRALKQSNAALFASIEQRYGVPPGPLLAIWGIETGFGAVHGNQNTLSSVATLAYDCRRSRIFHRSALRLPDPDRSRQAFGQYARLHAWRDRPDPIPAQDHAGLWHGGSLETRPAR